MWFGSNGSRSAAVGDKFLQVQDSFGEQVGDEACACPHSSAEDAREQAAQVRECLCSVDAPRRIRRDEVVGRQIDSQGIEVVADHLGADILAGGQPGQAGGMLKAEAVLEALEGFFDAPAVMIEVGECGGRILCGIAQRRHEHTHLAGRRHLTDQSHRRDLARTLVIEGIAAVRWRQGHHRLILAGAHETRDCGKGRGRIAAHAERNAPMQQGRHQPRSRIATVEHQHVLVAQAVETFEQHLALTHQGTVQDQRIEQLDTGTKQAKQYRLAYPPLRMH